MSLNFRSSFFFRKVFCFPHENHYKFLKKISTPGSENNYLFLDIGANRGQTIQSVLLYKKFRIISFEPIKYLADRLVYKYKKNKFVSIYNNFVMEKNGTIDLYVPFYKNAIFDGLASSDPNHAKKFFSKSNFFNYDESNLSINKYEVDSIKLDDMNLNPFILKADVQGAEMQVLSGALNTIKEFLPIIILERPSKNKEVSWLARLGYKPFIYRGL